MTCIHGGQVGLCRQCEHEGPRLGADPRDARIAELERLCNGELEMREHVAAERDRLAARVAELERETNRWQDVANETAANYWRLTEERNRLRRALEQISKFSVHPDGMFQWIGAGVLDVAREALAQVSQNAPETDLPPGRVGSRDMPDPTAARLARAVDTALRYLEHIADPASRRDCCKFAALNGYRRRHLKELAAEALAEWRRAREGGSDG